MNKWLRVMLAFGCALAACSKGKDPTPSESPAVKRGRPGGETDQQLEKQVADLEAASKRGEVEWYRTEGHDLITIEKGGPPQRQPFPVPKFHAGDAIDGIWLAPDGTLFTAGYMITGKPGPDTGAVHRLSPGGKLERVYESPERELYEVWGRTSSDVYAVGPKIVVHWDGSKWTELPITGITDIIDTVTGTAKDVWIGAVNNKPEESTIYRLDGDTWKAEYHVPCLVRSLQAGTAKVFAAGACDTVLVRDASGTWKSEQLPRGGAYELAAVSDSEVYVAAEDLLRRGSDGKWSVVKTGFPRVYTVERAHGDQVFVIGNLVGAGSESGIAVGARDHWTRLDVKNCNHAAGTESTVICTRERHVSAEPPEDLRKE